MDSVSSRPVSMMTGTWLRRGWVRMRRHTSKPSSPGMTTSSRTRSGRTASKAANPASPDSASTTLKPASRRASTANARVSASSSMIRMEASSVVGVMRSVGSACSAAQGGCGGPPVACGAVPIHGDGIGTDRKVGLFRTLQLHSRGEDGFMIAAESRFHPARERLLGGGRYTCPQHALQLPGQARQLHGADGRRRRLETMTTAPGALAVARGQGAREVGQLRTGVVQEQRDVTRRLERGQITLDPRKLAQDGQVGRRRGTMGRRVGSPLLLGRPGRRVGQPTLEDLLQPGGGHRLHHLIEIFALMGLIFSSETYLNPQINIT